MPRGTVSTFRRITYLAVPILFAWTASAAPAAGASNAKPYSATLTPASVSGGTSNAFTLTIFNESTQQQLGSANVSIPSGFSLSGALNAPAGSSYDTTTISLRNLAIPPAPSPSNPTSSVITFTASVPCTVAIYTWTMTAKQANNFNGSGNDFGYSGAFPTTQVSTACRLAFLSNATTGFQVASATMGANITTDPFNPTGVPKVRVAVVDAADNIITSSQAPITLAIDASSPSAGTTILSGTSTCSAATGTVCVTASSGVATFAAISIGKAGTYKLSGSSAGVTGTGPSNHFGIQDDVAQCPPTCSVNEEGNGLSSELTAGPSSTQGFIALSIGANTNLAKCSTAVYGAWTNLPNTTTVDEYGLSEAGAMMTVTITISKAAVLADGPNNSPTDYQVCYSTDKAGETFTDRIGRTIYPLGTASQPTSGLLPDCTNQNPTAPCVQSRTKTRAGQVILTVLVPQTDGKYMN